METIDTGLKRTRIKGEDDMNVDQPPEPPVSRAIEAKRRALSRFVRHVSYSITFMKLKCTTGWIVDDHVSQYARGHRN